MKAAEEREPEQPWPPKGDPAEVGWASAHHPPVLPAASAHPTARGRSGSWANEKPPPDEKNLQTPAIERRVTLGLDASVMCSCFRDGMTTPPPVPRDWLEIDADGQLELKQEHGTDTNWARLYKWKQSCCRHRGMNFASEHISNWTGYRLFQAALGDIGPERFPVLRRELPNANGGLTPPQASEAALPELDDFLSRGVIGAKTVLIDSATGENLYEYVAAYDGVFYMCGRLGIDAGLSESEFIAVERATGRTLFRSKRFRQFDGDRSPPSADDGRTSWQDSATGAVFRSGIAISGRQIPWENGSWQDPGGKCRFEYPAELHVERRQRTAAEFGDIVRALRTVFRASVGTGNPVRWG